MNLKQKIRQIETQINQRDKETALQDLLSPNYKYKREPFNNLNEMLKALNVIEEPPFPDEDIIRLLENKLISYDSPEMQEIQNKTIKEMKERM